MERVTIDRVEHLFLDQFHYPGCEIPLVFLGVAGYFGEYIRRSDYLYKLVDIEVRFTPSPAPGKYFDALSRSNIVV